ncbi:MAG: hypothetical protein RIE73_16680 [Coleofasciculus sp. C1-SOL-03]|uniref:hypothetical protein n=1 Tax=Coleofasciculus sp. C1-SOL-03 TaxID=3069522 RepID=UPI0032FA16C5
MACAIVFSPTQINEPLRSSERLPDVGEWEIRFCCVLVFVQGIGAHVYAPLRLIGGMVVGFNRQFMIIAIADRMRGRTSMRGGRTSMRPYGYPDQFSL